MNDSIAAGRAPSPPGAPPAPVTPRSALERLWCDAGQDAQACERVELTGHEPALPSSFAVGSAAQASIAAAALIATDIGRERNGVVQTVSVDMRAAALECCAYFTLDGRAPDAWDKLAGLYRCAPGEVDFVRLHTNFAHHRDGLLRLLGLPEGPETPRDAVARALLERDGIAFEQAASAAGMVVAAVRSGAQWAAHPQRPFVLAQPLVSIERIGDAPPLDWPPLARSARPLDGLRVVDLTRILAGPAGTRLLAGYGADVMLVNSPHLPNIEAIADMSRGKRSAFADLRLEQDRAGLRRVIADAHVWVQGYRPDALAGLGFGVPELAALRPGLVQVSLSAYGETGPWGGKRGFDSLVQAATGLNVDEALAAAAEQPKALPMQILDMASGALIAFGAQAALLRQRREGGSWHVRVSLARTGEWLRSLGRVTDGFAALPATPEELATRLEHFESGFGALASLPHAAVLSHTPAAWPRPSRPPGSAPLGWIDA